MAVPLNKQVYRNVQALRAGDTELGDMHLHEFHLIFSYFPKSEPQTDPNQKKKERERRVWFAYQLISQCTLRPSSPSSGFPATIRLRFRDFIFVSFNFPENKDARDAFEIIRARTCRLGSVDKLLAFEYRPPVDPPEAKINGWDCYDAKAEFRRQGISEKSADLGWRISNINKDYQFSPTYPAVLVVPNAISDTTLKHAGSFRSRARIPTLTYLHPVNNCTITRSSQPFTGLRLKRSIQDEKLVSACFSPTSGGWETDPSANKAFEEIPPASEVKLSIEEGGRRTEGGGHSSDFSMLSTELERMNEELLAGNVIFDEKTGKRLIYGAQRQNLIVDARPAINSHAMQIVGKGSENMDYYKFAKKVFLNIANIHIMRASLEKVVDAIKDAYISPYPANQNLLVKSDWLKHISYILDGSAIIARQVGIQHSNVLIHCSDGWDRTSQLSALSQLMLDPYYRTIDGFIVLVEKDWLSFGHMFQLRSGYLSHEAWFITDNDALAGSTINPGENETQTTRGGEVLETVFAGARRFFVRGSAERGETSDGDAVDEARGATPKEQDHATKPNDVSPVFHQFLDATYQLLRQHPTRFEFNERFLRRLLYHVYSCQYGTFLYNSECQRVEAKLRERTRSVWGYFLSRRGDFTNDQYEPIIDDREKGRERLVLPKLKDVRWWHQVFNRTDEDMNGALNASAVAAERVAAYSSGTETPPHHFNSYSGGDGGSSQSSSASPRRRSPQPPGLLPSQSVVTDAGTAQARTIATIQGRIAELGISTGVFGGADNGQTRNGNGDRELGDMGGQELKSMG